MHFSELKLQYVTFGKLNGFSKILSLALEKLELAEPEYQHVYQSSRNIKSVGFMLFLIGLDHFKIKDPSIDFKNMSQTDIQIYHPYWTI